MENYTGKILGNRYVLKDVIGVGGMAVVYKAVDNVDNKTVAVKILKDEYSSNDEFRRRFRNESKAISLLSHPNIVKVYDVSFGETVQYIVMEYIEGITLKQYIKQKGVLDWREALIFTAQILKGLRHAHDRGVIHRDIKPQNIMLLPDMRTIKVADFGIARLNNKNDTRTFGDGSAIGSVHYISPEQARGEQIDNRTDLYSVGVVLYEMITGKVPFQAENAVSVALMQVQNEAVLPRNINPSLPAGIEQITVKAMQKNREDRYQSAAEMLVDLDALRRNPTIRFDHYSYSGVSDGSFAGKRPEQYSSGRSVVNQDGPSKRTTVITPEDEEFESENERIANKSYTLPILVGIIFVFVVAVIGIIWFFFTNTEEVIVPKFEGKYIDEIRDDDDYKYFFENGLIEENLVYTTEYDEGYIFYQSEKEGTKLQISGSYSFIIKLNIAYTSESMTVPTLAEGTKLQQARSILQKMGFKVETEGVVDTSVDESTVIRMSPESGQSVAYGSTVTVYYAISDAGKVAVPSVVGDKMDVAKQTLEALGLKVIVEYEEVTDSRQSGVVIEQSIAADTTVIADSTEITIIVGATSTKTVELSIDLPDLTAYGDIYESVYVYVGGSLYKTYSSVKLDGAAYSIDIGGSEDTTFTVYINDQQVCTGSVNFSSSSPSVSNRKNTEYKHTGETTAPSTQATTAPTTQGTYTLPSYTGKTYTAYYQELIDMGFDNIVMVERASSTVPEGQVISVDTHGKSSFTSSELAGATITVYVSIGS